MNTKLWNGSKPYAQPAHGLSIALQRNAVSPCSTLFTLLRKANAPSFQTLARICKGFGISMVQSFEENNDRALLTDIQRAHLQKCTSFPEGNQFIADKYIDYLLSGNETAMQVLWQDTLFYALAFVF